MPTFSEMMLTGKTPASTYQYLVLHSGSYLVDYQGHPIGSLTGSGGTSDTASLALTASIANTASLALTASIARTASAIVPNALIVTPSVKTQLTGVDSSGNPSGDISFDGNINVENNSGYVVVFPDGTVEVSQLLSDGPIVGNLTGNVAGNVTGTASLARTASSLGPSQVHINSDLIFDSGSTSVPWGIPAIIFMSSSLADPTKDHLGGIIWSSSLGQAASFTTEFSHLGSLGKIESQWISYGDIAIAPGDGGGGSRIQLGTAALKGTTIACQYNGNFYYEPIGSGGGKSSLLTFISNYFNASNALINVSPGIRAESIDNTSYNGDTRLRFYNPSPSIGSDSTFQEWGDEGKLMGEICDSGWRFHGFFGRDNQQIVSSNTCSINLSSSYSKEILVNTSSVVFTSSILQSTSQQDHMQTRCFIKTGPFSPTITFPSTWNWAGPSGSIVTPPSSLNAGQVLIVNIESIGPREIDIFASCTIGSYSYTYDSDMTNFFNAANITNSVQKLAINSLVSNAKLHGWWNKCDCIYPFVGGTTGSHAVNLKNTGSFRIQWTGSISSSAFHTSTGATGDGINGFGNTTFIPNGSSNYQLTSSHLFAYIGSGPTQDFMYMIGSRNGAFNDTAGIGRKASFDIYFGGGLNCNNSTLEIAPYPIPGNLSGPTLISRTSSLGQAAYSNCLPGNAVPRYSNIRNEAAAAASAVTTTPFALFALLTDGNPSNLSDANLRGVTIGGAMTAKDWVNMKHDWDLFNDILSRKASTSQ